MEKTKTGNSIIKRILIKTVILLILLLLAGIALKILLVKEKWFNLSDSSNFEFRKDDTSDINVKQLTFYSDACATDLTDTFYNTKTYVCHINLDKVNDLKKFRIGLRYPSAFLIKINNKTVIGSPNLLYEYTGKTKYIISDHPIQKDNIIEFFHLSKDFLKAGDNLFELTIISDKKISDNYKPHVTIDALKSGYFITDFKTLKLKHNVSLSESTLPVLSISTKGKKIVDEPKIEAFLTVNDNNEEIKTNIKIEIRGKSSQDHDQLTLNYSVDLYNNDWKKQDLSLLGLPAESDWVLYTPSMDKSIIRNALVYTYSANSGHYAPRFKYCDLYINDQYVGIYLLIEKLNLASERINYFPKSDKKEVYFCKIDYPDSKYYGWKLEESNGGYIYVNVINPKLSSIDSLKANSFKELMNEINSAFKEDKPDYKKLDTLIDISTLIDYILLNELTKNPDAYRLSTYFTKAPGMKVKMGPFWDYDLAFGNFEMGIFAQTTGLCSSDTNAFFLHMLNWSEKMFNDSLFKQILNERWQTFRKGFLNNDSVMVSINELINQFEPSIKNHYNTIPLINEWVWPNLYVGGTYENEIFYLKNWILKRMYWMDQELLSDSN